jgi:hypothetical protein
MITFVTTKTDAISTPDGKLKRTSVDTVHTVDTFEELVEQQSKQKISIARIDFSKHEEDIPPNAVYLAGNVIFPHVAKVKQEPLWKSHV